MKRMIIKYTGTRKETWDVHLDTCVFAYNTSRQESTVHSPFEVMFGRVARLPIEVDQESEYSSKFFENYLEQPKVHVKVSASF